MEGYQKKLTYSPERVLTLDERIETVRNSIGDRVLSGEIGILDSTQEMGLLVRESMGSVVKEVSTEFNLDIGQQPFAVFLFGSPSRNSMLPNSDLDVGLVFAENCPEEIKMVLKKRVSALPFDKIDIASWETIDAMRKENCPDMIEFNKAIDARFIAGNYNLSEQHVQEVRSKDTREDKINRFITEYGLLHRYDYPSKRTEHGPNLKYDFGASRDIIFLDWYFLLNPNKHETGEDEPFFMKGLATLLHEGVISPDEKESLLNQIELISLVKFTLLSKFRRGGSKSLVHLSDFSLHEAYNEAPVAFEKLGVSNGHELVTDYYNAKLALHGLVDRMYTKVCAANPELSKMWGTAEEKMELDDGVLSVLNTKTWYNLVPFAIRSKSPEILDFLVNSILDSPGYEYILRIASENKFLKDETKQTLLRSKLADRFKKKLTAIANTNI